MNPEATSTHRILVIDDNPAIHEDFRKILDPESEATGELGTTAAVLFGRPIPRAEAPRFEIDCAVRGQEGLEKVRVAAQEGRPYAMAYVDVRMPNGWDGIATIRRIWEDSPDLQMVICTAFSDHSWEEIQEQLGHSDRFLILKKPFDNIEVRQLTFALSERARAERALAASQEQLAAAAAAHRAAEESLRQSEVLRRAMLDHSPAVIFTKDCEGRHLDINPEFEKWYGLTRGQVLGKTDAEIFPAAQAAAFRAHDLTVMATGQPLDFEETTAHRDGPRVSLVSKFPLRDAAGAIYAICGIATDITERKRLERDLLRAQRMEAIGTLAGGLAHDLNNVLSPIILAVDLLKPSLQDAASLEVLDIVEANTRRGAEMVRQVLSFARGVEGERVLLQPGYLIDAVRKIAADTFPKNLAVQTSIAPGLWNVLGDSTQLHQVLLNLCVNARDALPAGGQIVISATNVAIDEREAAMNSEAKAGPHVAIEVRDNGTGISAAIIERIFDPFFTTKELGQGTGLGLSTSLAIVRSHGGFFHVASTVGEGTRFTVHLPADAGSPVAAAPDPMELVRGHGERVLVIDDEVAIRAVAKVALEAFGYRVFVAADGAEGVALYAQHRDEIAVVLTDMMMPVMDGPATIEALRRVNPQVKIIAASGLKQQGQAPPEGGVRLEHFLPKPYTAEALLQMLAAVLSAPPPPTTA